ncbi:MAG: DUF4139 domain-containing protein [Elusimicrobia bacterium]|jgi:hypothetical protein|nr:DUF4139 domain-containing protein [Elusimicrobiota bacterium]
MKKLFLILFSIWFGAHGILHATDVTIYNNDLGLVREKRVFDLEKGVSSVTMDEVAARIDPTSVHFISLTDASALSVLEQNFQYDLVNESKLLEKYLGREIEIERFSKEGNDRREVLKGTLLSNTGGRVLQVGGKLYLNPDGRVVLPELPEGFVTKPQLLWRVSAQKAGKQECEIAYLTGGLSWKSDYVLKLSPTEETLDLNAWVTLTNGSGVAYREAKIKLVAGDVNRVPPPYASLMGGALISRRAEMTQPQFQEKSFFEYHLYTLQRPATLMNNETKQIELAASRDVPVKKLFIYNASGDTGGYYNVYSRTDPNYGASSDEKKVWVMLEFKNSKEHHLGLPLPKGTIRVYKEDSDGALEFIGEDAIDHTPKDELVWVKMGNAFDVVGERTRVHYQVSTDKKSMTETFEIKIRNHKEQAVTVRVVEPLYRWTNWRVTDSSQKWVKKDSQTIEFNLPIEKDGEGVVRYTVSYSW